MAQSGQSYNKIFMKKSVASSDFKKLMVYFDWKVCMILYFLIKNEKEINEMREIL